MEQKGLKNADGILGLSPDDPNNGPSYIAQLKDNKVIEQKIVSFFFSRAKQSEFTFGGYKQYLIKEGPQEDGFGIHWYNLIGTRYWEVEIRDLKVESQSIFSSETKIAILDSGTSMMSMPFTDFNKFKKIYQAAYPGEFTCLDKQNLCFFMSKCSNYLSKLDYIKIQLSDHWEYKVHPEDYTIDYEETQNGTTLQFCIFGV